MMRIMVLLVVAALLPRGVVAAQTQSEASGTIQGVVQRSDGTPVPNLSIRAEGGGLAVTAESDVDGTFVIGGLPPGRYSIEALGPFGRLGRRVSITLRAGAAVDVRLVTSSVTGEATADAIAAARYRFGPIGITPALETSTIGIDTNVFNDAEAAKHDTAVSVAPLVGLALSGPRLNGVGSVRADYLYFQKYSSERTANTAVEGRIEIPLGVVTPFASGSVSSGRRREGHEIDLRAQRLTTDARIGVESRIVAGLSGALAVERHDYSFGADQIFRGVNLGEMLNHQTDSVDAELRRPLTRWLEVTGGGGAVRHRFPFASGRDADSGIGLVGVNVDRADVFTTRFRIGRRTFEAVRGGVADFRGLVSSLDANAALWGRTRLSVLAQRDLTFSFEPLFPYFVDTSSSVFLTQSVTSRLQLRFRQSYERLAYRGAPNVASPIPLDEYNYLGGGIGVDVGGNVWLGMDGGWEHRSSQRPDRAFTGYTLGAAVTFGTAPLRGRREAIRP